MIETPGIERHVGFKACAARPWGQSSLQGTARLSVARYTSAEATLGNDLACSRYTFAARLTSPDDLAFCAEAAVDSGGGLYNLRSDCVVGVKQQGKLGFRETRYGKD